MALNYDPRMYSQGSVVFDSRPHAQLYGQLLAKKQAQTEAFDEYIRNLNKNVNSAGLRNADRQVFDKKLADWQNYAMQNRDAIRNRKGGADIEFQNKYQDILNLTARSKGLEDSKKPAIELLLKPEVRERLGEDFIEEISAHDQPIYKIGKDGSIQENPDFRPLDYTKLNFSPKPFEQDKYFKQFEDVKRMELPPQVVKDPKNLTQTVTTTSVFDDEAKDLIATRAVTDYMQNQSFKSVVDKLNPADYNPIFKANYGHDIQSPADLAAAYTLKGLQQKVVTSKLEDDTFARQKQMQAIRQADAKELLNLRESIKKTDKATQDLWVDNYTDALKNEAMKGEKILFPGAPDVSYQVALDPVMTKGLIKGKSAPVKLLVTKDGKWIPIYYKTDEKGVVELDDNDQPIIDKKLSVPITDSQIKLSLGKQAGVKQANMEMSADDPLENTDPLGIY